MTKKTLVKESVIRRWGKLANMAPLTENWLETISEEEGEEEAAADEMAAGEAEVEAGGDMEASSGDMEAVESIVNAVVDAIAQETGVEIEVEGGAEDEEALGDEADALDMDAEMRDDAPHDRGEEDPMQHDRGAHNRPSVYNRTDDLDEKKKPAHKNTKSEKDADEGHDATEDKDKAKGKFGDGSMKKEELELDVVDDEALTEAVLKRVVERLLRRK